VSIAGVRLISRDIERMEWAVRQSFGISIDLGTLALVRLRPRLCHFALSRDDVK
jgi:hypothetical protein